MNYIKELWQKKEVRVFIWNMLSLFVGTSLTLISDDIIHIEEPYLTIVWLLVVPLVMQGMKAFNTKYLWDAWVSDATKIEELESKINKLRNHLEDKE